MLTHVTDSGVIYEVAPPPEEVQRRMVAIIKKLYPTWLELRASAGEADHATGALHPQPRPPARVGADRAGSPCKVGAVSEPAPTRRGRR